MPDVVLPADGHVHSQWSWDAPDGAMERTCARAVESGLLAVAFTEHADYTNWVVEPGELDGHDHLKAFLTPDSAVAPPPLDVDGYLDSVQRCRDLFPGLRIITGIELGEPHWHNGAANALLRSGVFDRVLASLHCLPLGERFAEPPYHYRQRPTPDVMRDYPAEITRLIQTFDTFAVLAHIDYAVRTWPTYAGPFDPHVFQDEFRHALRVLADRGRVLEVNTRGPLRPEIVRWWHDEGGQAITFGSDAHDPDLLAHRFPEAAAMVEANCFHPGRHPHDAWTRSS